MNRIVLIGNGFDLAHGLKTSYKDFINWYWEQRVRGLYKENRTRKSMDGLSTFTIHKYPELSSWYTYYTTHYFVGNIDASDIFKTLKQDNDVEIKCSDFFEDINKCIETKNWVDIENEYYKHLKGIVLNTDINDDKKFEKVKELHQQMSSLQQLLAEYLKSSSKATQRQDAIYRMLYCPILEQEVSPNCRKDFLSYVDYWITANEVRWQKRLWQYCLAESNHKYSINDSIRDIQEAVDKKYPQTLPDEDEKRAYRIKMFHQHNAPLEVGLPERILFVSFNYTKLFEENYLSSQEGFQFIHLHGSIDNPTSMIFGYGDDLDDDYKAIQNKNENAYLEYFKSMKYLEADAYHKVLDFAESDLFQVSIFGHSCGNSDRTLLNTLFEHKNCISVKPYYFVDKEGKNHYMDITLNIARNFTDMKLMRNRVVNKTYTEVFSKGGEKADNHE